MDLEFNTSLSVSMKANTEDANICFYPYSDFQHKITVQASPSHDRRRSVLSSGSSPPTSPPMLPRLRAIQREHLTRTRVAVVVGGGSKGMYSFEMSNTVTPAEGCTAWGRSTGVQQDDEEAERKGSRKKGRCRGCGPHREHSADAR